MHEDKKKEHDKSDLQDLSQVFPGNSNNLQIKLKSCYMTRLTSKLPKGVIIESSKITLENP